MRLFNIVGERDQLDWLFSLANQCMRRQMEVISPYCSPPPLPSRPQGLTTSVPSATSYQTFSIKNNYKPSVVSENGVKMVGKYCLVYSFYTCSPKCRSSALLFWMTNTNDCRPLVWRVTITDSYKIISPQETMEHFFQILPNFCVIHETLHSKTSVSVKAASWYILEC